MKPDPDSAPFDWRGMFVTLAIAVIMALLLCLGIYLWSLPAHQLRRLLGVRRSGGGLNTSLIQDGRILGNAAQQYFLITGQSKATFGYDPTTGAITGDLTPWLTNIGKNYEMPDTTIEADSFPAFTIRRPPAFNGKTLTFTDEGKTTYDPSKDY